MINKIERLIPVLQQQVEIRKTLFDHETGSKVNYLQALQALIERSKSWSAAEPPAWRPRMPLPPSRKRVPRPSPSIAAHVRRSDQG